MTVKKLVTLLLAVLLIMGFGLMAIASDSDETDTDQGKDSVQTEEANNDLGDYSVEIVSCRLAKDYENKPVVIVKYNFTNNGDEAANFSFAFDDNVYQDGIGLNNAYFLDDSYNYDSDAQLKDIKTGASLDVEVAYELNDTETDITVEIEELISFSDKKITKTFSIK